MVGLGRKGQIELECPFCNKGRVKVFHKEGYLQGRKSHIAAGNKVKFYNGLMKPGLQKSLLIKKGWKGSGKRDCRQGLNNEYYEKF